MVSAKMALISPFKSLTRKPAPAYQSRRSPENGGSDLATKPGLNGGEGTITSVPTSERSSTKLDNWIERRI